MGILRWLLTISFIGIALFLALLLGVLLLGVYLVMRLTGALRIATVRTDGVERNPVTGGLGGMAQRGGPVAPRPTGPADLPAAPAGVEIFHMRAWDESANRAVDRWYYKDEQGQWIFVRSPERP